MFSKVLSLLKSIYVNFRLCSFKDAFHLPILVKWNCKLLSLKGTVEFTNGTKFGMLKIGFSSVGIIDPLSQRSILEISGSIKINRGGYFGSGSKIIVLPNAILEIGDKFQNSAQITIICANSIKIGDNVLTSWETLIMDTDFHCYINSDGSKSDLSRPIIIGNNCWLGVRSVVLKGSVLADGCIVAANALISGRYNDEKCIIGGVPGVVIKRGCVKEN